MNVILNDNFIRNTMRLYKKHTQDNRQGILNSGDLKFNISYECESAVDSIKKYMNTLTHKEKDDFLKRLEDIQHEVDSEDREKKIDIILND